MLKRVDQVGHFLLNSAKEELTAAPLQILVNPVCVQGSAFNKI